MKMKTGNIGIRNLADIGVADIDVYGTKRDNYIVGEEGLDYICVSDVYQHKKGTTYYDLDGKGIILDDHCVPYAFVGSLSPKFKGRLSIIQNAETGKLFYPKPSEKGVEKHGYIGYNAYNKLNVEFINYKYSNATGVKVYANENGEYYANDKYIGKNKKCRDCPGLPQNIISKPIDTNIFTINKKTFKLPDEFSVVALDANDITKKMTLLVNSDRRKIREDKEDQEFHLNSLPTDESTKKIYKKVATLWNNYENILYVNYLTPDPVPGSDIGFILETKKLDDKKLLMPELIKNGVLTNISEGFLQDFFRNKIKGNANAPIGLYSFYQNDETKQKYELAGQELVQHFYGKSGGNYYKTKTIADAIYKTDSGKFCIHNVIKLVDQIFQYQMSKFNQLDKKFLEKPLDENWFKEGIDVPTSPSFGISSLDPQKPDEERLALFCIGGLQGLKVAVKNFTPINLTKEKKIGYEATIILQYLDTFGVSESDYTKDLGVGEITNITEYNYRGGVMSQWILQHQYGYKPFTDHLSYEIKIKKNWTK